MRIELRSGGGPRLVVKCLLTVTSLSLMKFGRSEIGLQSDRLPKSSSGQHQKPSRQDRTSVGGLPVHPLLARPQHLQVSPLLLVRPQIHGVVQEITAILLPKKCSGFEVITRRRFFLLQSVAELAERAMRKRVPPTRRVMVLREFHPDTLLKDSEAVWCRIFGGSLTSLAWLRDAIDHERPPKAIPFRDISAKRKLVLYFSEQFKEQCKQSSVALTILAQESRMVRIINSLAEVRENCVEYKAVHGETSQPWHSNVILVAEQSEVEQVCHEAGVDVPPRVVRTLEQFLSKYSVVQNDLVCPGHWR